MTYRGQTSPAVGTSGGTPFSSTIGGNVSNGANAVFTTSASGSPVALVNPNGSTVSLISRAGPPPTTIFIGNSITNYGFDNPASSTTSGYSQASEQTWVQQFAGNIINRVGQVTAAANLNSTGDLGFPGQSIAQLNGYLQSLLFPALDVAGVTPALIIGHALYENDTGSFFTSLATLQANTLSFIQICQTKYPGVQVLICGPRPDGRNTLTAAQVQVIKNLIAWLQTIDDGATVFFCDLLTNSPYLDPTDYPAPLVGYTYTTTLADAIGTVSVHPRQNACSINGRLIAATVTRAVGRPISNVAFRSINDGLVGSVSMASGKTTGTGPTGASVAIQPSGAAAALVSLAGQPGWQLTFTADPAQPADLVDIRFGAPYTPTKFPRRFSPYWVVKIVSGAAALHNMYAQTQVTFVGGAPANHRRGDHSAGLFTSPASLSAVYQNGDVIYMFSPWTDYTANGRPTSFFSDLIVLSNAATPIVLQVLAAGYLASDLLNATTAITVTASPFTWQNTTGQKVKVVVTPNGATITDISIGPQYYTSLLSTGLLSGMFVLDVGDFIQASYSAGLPIINALPTA